MSIAPPVGPVVPDAPEDPETTVVSADTSVDGEHPAYPLLFSPWQLRGQSVKNRIVFPPTCATWVDNMGNGQFTEMATSYYEERAKHETGLIIIGATHVHPDSVGAPVLTAQLYNDNNIEPLRKIADAVHRHGTKIGIQLVHVGMRSQPTPRLDPLWDEDAAWYTVSPSQIPLGEFPGSMTPKELTDHEIREMIDAHASAAERAVRAGLDGVELHASHGYLVWQFLSPLYNHRTDKWGGSGENRLRFMVECLAAMRDAIGSEAFLGYRINSTSFWPGDLELPDVKQIVADLEGLVDTDYVNLSAGVHHAFIHTPMHFEAGWEAEYAREIKSVSSKPIFLVGRITTPEQAEELLERGDGDVICLGRQMFADPEWGSKAKQARSDDIRRCVAANYCWRAAVSGRRVQCVYNPTMGREAKWGAGTLQQVAVSKRVLVIGGGPSGLEYARVASARGHQVTVLEGRAEVGGHARLHALLPKRAEYGRIGAWLGEQAVKNGAQIIAGSRVDATNLDAILDTHRPDHVVVATGSRPVNDGFQGWTGKALPGVETANVMTWEDVLTGDAQPNGAVVVLDDLCDLTGPLTAVAVADHKDVDHVAVVTRWPMIGMDTLLDVAFPWMMPQVYEKHIELVVDHFVDEFRGSEIVLSNVHEHGHGEPKIMQADSVIMVVSRQSVNSLVPLLEQRGMSIETIGDAAAPRGTYEAVYEGHRAARKL